MVIKDCTSITSITLIQKTNYPITLITLITQEQKPIAIFDSGIGGLTVLYKAIQSLPAENFIYYADTAHVPYGSKPKEEVRKYILDAAAFLNNIGIKALV